MIYEEAITTYVNSIHTVSSEGEHQVCLDFKPAASPSVVLNEETVGKHNLTELFEGYP